MEQWKVTVFRMEGALYMLIPRPPGLTLPPLANNARATTGARAITAQALTPTATAAAMRTITPTGGFACIMDWIGGGDGANGCSNGSYYYSNADGSTYYNNGRGEAWYTPASQK
ncbi:uncharacterized protein ACLA_043610 [Aspergillus clavatus NRRL 1]|uniref:Uncharacterized protein n=1 Tax=Aspergillus clavatus (strain ATCC 1007 / CBS 513.65 / DSM 816 / NCTC 3887 / NRRL 1 / QM 1276 / 107) TaxID=344612 RepID=A1C8K4_ASPCL|nr:uncharacterized protein ACLA_043610 [Aspergillus clavatus NRRL 1]EAW13641.1 hypothetical protein ACLA_043610 [Aspergillus clavatus NRRL 1]